MKLNFLLIATLFFSFCTESFSQKKNEIRTFYGFTDSYLARTSLDGDASYDNEDCSKFGIKFLREIKPNLSIETGINFTKATIKITPPYMGQGAPRPSYEDFKMVSIPVYLNYSFKKYFFINGGTILHFQQDKTIAYDSQDGIGFGIGAGAKYQYNNFLVYINPTFKIHTVIPFHSEQYQQRLIEGGLHIGIGYQF